MDKHQLSRDLALIVFWQASMKDNNKVSDHILGRNLCRIRTSDTCQNNYKKNSSANFPDRNPLEVISSKFSKRQPQ
jgi:hypothetical protein